MNKIMEKAKRLCAKMEPHLQAVARTYTRKKDLTLRFVVGENGSWTDHKRILVSISTEEAKVMSEEDMKTTGRFKTCHEVMHILYTVSNEFQTAIKEIVEKWEKHATEKGIHISRKVLMDFARLLTNGLEDGRIENIMVVVYKGLKPARDWYRLRDWNEQEITSETQPAIALYNQILTTATMGIKMKGFDNVFAGTEVDVLHTKCLPHISKAVAASSCKECMDEARKLADLIEDFLFENCSISEEEFNDIMDRINDFNIKNRSENNQEDGNRETPDNMPIIGILTDDMEESDEEDGVTPDIIIDLRTKRPEQEDNEEDSENQGSSSKSDEDNSQDEAGVKTGEQTSEGLPNKDEQGQNEKSTQKSSANNNDSNSLQSADEEGDNEGSQSEKDGQPESSSTSSSNEQSSDSENNMNESNNSEEDSLEKSFSNKESRTSEDVSANNMKTSPNETMGTFDRSKKQTMSDEELLKKVLKRIEEAKDENREENRDLTRQIQNAERQREAEEEKSGKLSKETLNNIASLYGGKDFAEVDLTKINRIVKHDAPEDIKRKGLVAKNQIENILASMSEMDKKEVYDGDLDSGELGRFVLGFFDVFQEEGEPFMLDMSCYLLKDNSASMRGYKDEAASKGLAVIEEAMKDLMPLKISDFSDLSSCEHQIIKNWDDKGSHSYSYTYWKHNNPRGSNDDAYSIEVAAHELMLRPEEKKLLVIFSDGAPCCELFEVRQAVEKARKNGIFVVSLFFGDQSFIEQNRDTYEDMYGKYFIGVTPENIGKEFIKFLKIFVNAS